MPLLCPCARIKHVAAAMEDMLKMMGIEAGSKGKSKGPDKHRNAIKVKKKEGVREGSSMDSQVRVRQG